MRDWQRLSPIWVIFMVAKNKILVQIFLEINSKIV